MAMSQVMTDQTARTCARQSMVSGEVAGDAAYHRALQTASRLGASGRKTCRGRDGDQDRLDGDMFI